eukprot:UN34333
MIHLVCHGCKKENLITLEALKNPGYSVNLNADELPLSAAKHRNELQCIFVYAKHADKSCKVFADAGVNCVVGVKYDYGVLDESGEDFVEIFYKNLFEGKSTKESFGNALDQVKQKHTIKSVDEKFFYYGKQIPVFKSLGNGSVKWKGPPTTFIPPLKTTILGGTQVMSNMLASFKRGTQITWLYGLEGSGKTTVAVATCHYLNERKYIDGRPDPIIYIDLKDIQEIETWEAHEMEEMYGPTYGGAGDRRQLLSQIAKLMQHAGINGDETQHNFMKQLYSLRVRYKKTDQDIKSLEKSDIQTKKRGTFQRTKRI